MKETKLYFNRTFVNPICVSISRGGAWYSGSPL